MFQQRISFFCCQRIARRTRIFFCVLLRLLRFLLLVSFVSFVDHLMTRITRILVSSFDDLFSCQRTTRIICFIRFIRWLSFINNYLWNLCNLLTFIIQFHGYSYLRVLRALRWQPLTMSDVSRTFFVHLCHEQRQWTFSRLSVDFQ